MYLHTAEYDAAMRASSQRVIFKAQILLGNEVRVPELWISGGTLSIDASAAIRRTGDITIPDAPAILGVPRSEYSPYGREIRIWRGLVLPSGLPEWIPVATLRISRVAGSNREITLTCYDRARSASRARFEKPYVIEAGTNYAIAIETLLLSRLPGVTTQLVSTTRTTPLLVFDQSSDPWDAIQEMARNIGCEAFFDPMGVFVLRAEPDPASVSLAWEYKDDAVSIHSQVNEEVEDEPGYNGVVVDGEPPDAEPVQAIVYDNDPTSPTYAQGPYGKVPRFYRSQYITTEEQCLETAQSMLLAERGNTEVVTFSAIPHPAHDVKDLVLIQDSESGVNDRYLLNTYSLPLDETREAVGSARRRRVA